MSYQIWVISRFNYGEESIGCSILRSEFESAVEHDENLVWWVDVLPALKQEFQNEPDKFKKVAMFDWNEKNKSCKLEFSMIVAYGIVFATVYSVRSKVCFEKIYAFADCIEGANVYYKGKLMDKEKFFNKKGFV